MAEPPFLAEFYNAWVNSPHADASAEAFVHWDAEGEIPESCARCHSTPGYRDYVGADDSEAGVVDAPAPIGTTVTCDACHNSATATLTNVTFPSGVEVTENSSSARCMVCHQGRASGLDVDQSIADAGLAEDLNAPSEDLGFINIHYYAAAASLFGSEVHGGYEFEGKVYMSRNQHVPGYDTCASCHSPHTLEVQVEACASCHEDVETADDLQGIRMNGSLADYDGDGNNGEGIAEEIQGLQEMTYEAMQIYAREIAGTPLIYNAGRYPYFFADVNDNGEIDEDEGAYNAFTGNLLKAAYNYQVSLKDPGGFAHNPSYHIELLYDTIEMLNAQVGEGVDLSQAARNDLGHFDTASEPFRHWDAEGEVPGTCAKCHTAVGLPFYLEHGVNIAVEPPSSSLACTTCHSDLGEFLLYEIDEVQFPSGEVVSFGDGAESNLCLNCHQGRESTVSVNKAIAGAGVGDDEVSESLNFRNPHYFAAGASLFGTQAKGAYEYEGKEYNGRFEHTRQFDECADCHRAHELTLRDNLCSDCHENVESTEDIFMIRQEDEDVDPVDYDGDGDVEEPVRDEIMALEDALLVAIQDYATNVVGTSIAYNPNAYPYFYADPNGDGVLDEDEMADAERYAQWTPTLLRAAYNYQFVQKDPGAFAHNADYILQVLYDSIEGIGGEDAVANFNRPPVLEFDED
ncbi:MAG: cytochrome c family protein [Anaerolineae bacterium]|nr:cytochrome c family protein [Anaerolineae bacterium]